MRTRVIFAALIVAILASCGVKSDLLPPADAIQNERTVDSSKPPQPLGQ